MQALVNAVRNSGVSNLVLVAGMVWSYDLSTPVPGMGQLIYQQLLSYVQAKSPTPTPTP